MGFTLYSQQQTQYTLYMFNKAEFNPATTGYSDAVCAYGAARFQWMGMKDDSNRIINPRSYLFNIEMPIYSIRSGVGVSVNYSQLGFENNFDIKLNYAYHHPIGDDHLLSIGFSVELMNKSIDYSQLFVFDNGDPVLSDNGIEKGILTDFGLGLYYQYEDKFYTGVSASQIMGASSQIGNVTFKLVPHYYFMTGYNFTLKRSRKSNLVLVTGLLAKTTIEITQFELHTILRFNNRYWAGLTYRMEDDIGIVAGVNINDFSYGLSYDITTSALAKTGSMGSLEFFIRYCYTLYPKISCTDW